MRLIQLLQVVLLPQLLTSVYINYPQRSIYNKLTQEREFEGFTGLIRHNKEARIDLVQKELTLFVPTNAAFRNYKGALHSELAFYHMSYGNRSLKALKLVQDVASAGANFPKLWITTTGDDDIFVNNAKILKSRSDYNGRTSNGSEGKSQVLHVIDEVLDPIIRSPKSPRTAHDFLETRTSLVGLRYKVKQHDLAHLYYLNGTNTYFMPVDSGIDPYKFKMLNKNAIFGHIVPNHVLFTRPALKGVNYKTMKNDRGIYMELSMEEIDGKVFVQGGTISSEIIEPNIPVFNGVVHLIAQPLGILERALKPFPYLPILEKLATDPALSISYTMGEDTGFNKIFTTHKHSFTYFVPNDYSWKQMKRKGLSFSGSDVELLKKHLIVSQTPLSMEYLMALTSGRNFTDIELKTLGEPLRILVLQIEGNFYIRWNKTYIKVLRPDYECTDGLVHILAGPIALLG